MSSEKTDDLTKEQKQLIKLYEKSDISQKDLELILKKGTKPTVVKTHKHYFSNKHVKIGYFSDSHIGEKCFDEKEYFRAIQFFAKEKVSAIYHVGDVVEGPPKREGSVFNQTHIGATQQATYAASLFDESKIKIYGISGNHDDWYKEVGNTGLHILELIDGKSKKFTNLGARKAFIRLSPSVTLMLRHPGDGSAYALSYKGQKFMESIGSDTNKPNIVLNGHYHKALSMHLDNITYIEAGTLCDKSSFQLSKNLSNHKGFGMLDIWYNNKGVERVAHTFIPSETRW